MSNAIPTVVIVGRPNVGKSTLFNRITGQRRAIVGDEPGITRDRIHGPAEHDGRRFELIDTGGIVVHDQEYIPARFCARPRWRSKAPRTSFSWWTGAPKSPAPIATWRQMLKRLGKPVSLAVNKIDTAAREGLAHEFYGLGHRRRLSGLGRARHRRGCAARPRDRRLRARRGRGGRATAPAGIKVAIIGRPNVGKSTLLNALTGQERAIVSPVAGTTRDAVDEKVTRDGTDYIFVDTAGIRRKGKTRDMAEKLSVVMARRNIRMAHVVLLVLDATEGVVGLDATIAGYAHEGGRALIICVNKWDEMKGQTGQKKNEFEQQIRDQFKFLDYAPVVFLSAKTGAGVGKLFRLIREVYESASRRISTGELNRFVEHLQFEERKIYYITQHSIRPPAFVVFTDGAGAALLSRALPDQPDPQAVRLPGTPILLKTKSKNRKK